MIAIRGLTRQTHGNATGLGLVEFCRSRVLRERDDPMTRLNCLTGGHAIAAMTPLDYETDREILDVAIWQSACRPPQAMRLMWIRNTLQVAEVECSVAYWDEAQRRPDLTILGEPRPLPFDADGNLPDPPQLE